MPLPYVHHFAVAVTCTLLVACKAEVSGSPSPPTEFGAVSKPLLGCPSVQGVYAWPPVAGTYSDQMATNREPWEGGIPVPARRGAMQIWVKQSGTGMVFRSRSARRQAGLRDRTLTEWSYAEYPRSSYSCIRGLLVVKAVDVETTEDFGGAGIRRGFKLAALKDGSLAVGVNTVVHGRTSPIFAWGDVSVGSIPMSDRIIWRWSKLSRLESGEQEPAPVNAALAPRQTAESGREDSAHGRTAD
ncbi:MAG: hypothetical protein K2X67_17445 [Burkholderiales bacterium]|jgi:hypothetical protein|nr:hypothetical protein [Burkholderiales bacterium]